MIAKVFMRCLILFVMLRYYISATDILIAQYDTAVNFFMSIPAQPVSLSACANATAQ